MSDYYCLICDEIMFDFAEPLTPATRNKDHVCYSCYARKVVMANKKRFWYGYYFGMLIVAVVQFLFIILMAI